MWIVNVISNFAGARVQLSLAVLIIECMIVGAGGPAGERFHFIFHFFFVYVCKEFVQ